MANTPREAIAAQYQNNSIYVLLSSRGAQPGFHWGIFIPTASPHGHSWDATNREGGWKLEHRESDNAPFNISLVLARKIGTVEGSTGANTWQTCVDVLNGVPAEGRQSTNSDEEFNCRVWVKDALVALRDHGVIVLSDDVDSIENDLVKVASEHKDSVETGASAAKVEN